MKKLLLSLVVLSVGAFASSAANGYTIEFTKGSSSDGSALSTSTNVATTVTEASTQYVAGKFQNVTRAYYNSSKGLKFGSGSGTGNATFSLSTAGQVAAKSITINAAYYGSDTNANVRITINGSITNATTSLTSTLSETTFEFATPTIIETIKLESIGTNAKKSRAYVGAVTITPDETSSDLAPANLKFPKPEYTATLGTEFGKPTLTKDTDAAPAYISTNELVATVDAGTGDVTLWTAGTTEIKATTEATETYAAGTASYTLTVIDPNAPFEIYSSDLGADFTFENPAGLEVWKHDTQYGLKGSAYLSGTIHAVEAIAVSPVIDLTNRKDLTLDFKNAFNSYKISDTMIDVADFSGYAYIVVKEENATEWTSLGEATAPSKFGWDFYDNATINLNAYSGKKIQIGFKYVSTAECAGIWEVNQIRISGKEGINPPKTPSELSFSSTTYSVTEGTEDLSDAPKLDNPLEIEVVYSSSNEEVAMLETDGSLVLMGATGTTTISAAPADAETYEGTATYTLTVTPKPVLGAITVNGTAIEEKGTINGYEGDTFTFASENAEMLEVTILDGAGEYVVEGEIVEAPTYAWTAPAIDEYTVDVTSIGCNDTKKVSFTIAITEKTIALVADFIFSGADANVVALANKTIEATNSTKQGASNDLNGVTLTAENGVTVTTAISNKESHPRYWSTTNGIEARIYTGNTLTVAAPAGYKLVNVEFTKGPNNAWTMTEATSGAFTADNDLIWSSGETTAASVVFSIPAGESRTDIGSISVTIERDLTPAVPTITIDGVDVTNFDENYNLNEQAKAVTITAAEGTHIYHKFAVSTSAPAVEMLAETTADGFTHVEGNTTTLNISENGTLEFYAEDPATGTRSDIRSLTFNGAAAGISEIEASGSEAARWYDLQGRRVAAPAKGNVYIIKQGSKTSKRAL